MQVMTLASLRFDFMVKKMDVPRASRVVHSHRLTTVADVHQGPAFQILSAVLCGFFRLMN